MTVATFITPIDMSREDRALSMLAALRSRLSDAVALERIRSRRYLETS